MANKKSHIYITGAVLVGLILIILRIGELKSIKPTYAKLYTALGITDEKKGKLEKARQNYKRAIINNPNYREAYFYLGELSGKSGNAEEKLKNFRRVVELGPDWVKVNKQLQTSDIKIDEHYGLACYEVGVDAFKKNNMDEAINFLEKATEYNGSFIEAYVKLGEAYLIKGEKKKAIGQYQKILNVQRYAELDRLDKIMQHYGVKIGNDSGVAYEQPNNQ